MPNLVFRLTILGMLLLTFGITDFFRKQACNEGGMINRQDEGWIFLALRMTFALPLLMSISLAFGDWIILGYLIAGILAIRLLVIPAEEKQLLDTFGEDYERYRVRTGALLPWIR